MTLDFTRLPNCADDARQILEDACRRAIARSILGTIPALLVLWSILRWERKLALAAIEGIIGDCHDLEMAVDNALRGGLVDRTQSSIDYSRIVGLANVASGISRKRECEYIGSEHLLLALCTDYDGVTAKMLARFQISEASVVDCLLRIYVQRDA